MEDARIMESSEASGLINRKSAFQLPKNIEDVSQLSRNESDPEYVSSFTLFCITYSSSR